jgi:hypothetical protein
VKWGRVCREDGGGGLKAGEGCFGVGCLVRLFVHRGLLCFGGAFQEFGV